VIGSNGVALQVGLIEGVFRGYAHTYISGRRGWKMEDQGWRGIGIL